MEHSAELHDKDATDKNLDADTTSDDKNLNQTEASNKKETGTTDSIETAESTDTVNETNVKPAANITEEIKEEPIVEGLVICPDPLINVQLVRGLEDIRDRFVTQQLSLVGPHHVDVYNSLTRAFHNLSNEDFKVTLTNLFDYLNKYTCEHCHINVILQNVAASGLSVDKQKEYIKVISLLLTLREPQGRGSKAKRINWNSFPAGLMKLNADVITKRLQMYFNII